jgi:propionyl-CoA synthetase
MYVTLALDKHIQDGYGDQVAFIYDSPVTQTIRKYTFRSKTEVAKLAGGMQSLGLKRYSHKFICLIPQAAFAMLACENWRNPFSSFGGFATRLAIRIDDCKTAPNHNRVVWNRS